MAQGGFLLMGPGEGGTSAVGVGPARQGEPPWALSGPWVTGNSCERGPRWRLDLTVSWLLQPRNPLYTPSQLGVGAELGSWKIPETFVGSETGWG